MKSTPRGPRNMNLALFLHTPDAPEELFWGKKKQLHQHPTIETETAACYLFPRFAG